MQLQYICRITFNISMIDSKTYYISISPSHDHRLIYTTLKRFIIPWYIRLSCCSYVTLHILEMVVIRMYTVVVIITFFAYFWHFCAIDWSTLACFRPPTITDFFLFNQYHGIIHWISTTYKITLTLIITALTRGVLLVEILESILVLLDKCYQ